VNIKIHCEKKLNSDEKILSEFFLCGKISHAIIERLEQKNFDSPQERDEFWKKI